MDFAILLISAGVGFAAGYAWAYTQNPFMGFAVLGFALIGGFGIATTSSPGDILETFAGTVGIGGFIVAAIGAAAGAYFGNEHHNRANA